MLVALLTGWFGKRLGVALARLLPYILGALAVILAGWLFWNNAYDRGVTETERKYQTLILQERHRQIEANSEALETALKKQREYERLLNERDAQISDLLEEGAKDPNASRPSIGSDSVRRLNRIR